MMQRAGAMFGVICAMLWLSACGLPLTTKSTVDPLIYDAPRVARADRLAIFIPGALSSVAIFDGSADWEAAGYARALYRYPGLDDLPNDHIVSPAVVAAEIAAFANRYPDKDIAVVGYSTGGPIALLAAPQISKGRQVHVAAMSTAVAHGGGLPTLLRGAVDVGRAITGAGTLHRPAVWKRFWSGLLYGPAALDDPAFAERLARDIAAGEKIIVRLEVPVALAHVLGLPGLRLPEDLDLSGVEVAFFVGLQDPVFSLAQTRRFARQVGDVTIYGYPAQGHLLFFTRPDVFDDIRDFVEGRPVR